MNPCLHCAESWHVERRLSCSDCCPKLREWKQAAADMAGRIAKFGRQKGSLLALFRNKARKCPHDTYAKNHRYDWRQERHS